VAKLSYQFVKTHASIVSSDDGSFMADMTHYNPRQLFAAGTSMQQVFDIDGDAGSVGAPE
jgi:hypothetical protein